MNKHSRDPGFLAHLGGLAGAGPSRFGNLQGTQAILQTEGGPGQAGHWLTQEGKGRRHGCQQPRVVEVAPHTPSRAAGAGQGGVLAVLIPVLGVGTAGSHVRPDGSPCGRFLRLSQQTLARPEAVREGMLRVYRAQNSGFARSRSSGGLWPQGECLAWLHCHSQEEGGGGGFNIRWPFTSIEKELLGQARQPKIKSTPPPLF